MNTPSSRIATLDAVRGFAVMGILLINIVAFAMPQQAYLNPLAWGGTSPADLSAWAVNFVLVEGKMRALFSLLFGASTLLVIERADAAGQSGTRTHFWRMVWLLVFGLLHFYMIWFGDILVLYALFGFVAVLFVRKPAPSLVKWAIGFFVVNFLMWGAIMGGSLVMQAIAIQPGADPAMVANLNETRVELGEPGSKAIASEVAAYTGSYADAFSQRAKGGLFGPLFLVIVSGFETLGLLALGMAFFKNGFLRGEWEPARYQRTMMISYLIGIPPMIALAGLVWARGFNTLETGAAMFGAPHLSVSRS